MHDIMDDDDDDDLTAPGLVSTAGAEESIDELIRTRRLHLDDLRARNRAMMESLATTPPSLHKSTPPQQQHQQQQSEAPNDEVELKYLKAYMEHAKETRIRLDNLEKNSRKLEELIGRRLNSVAALGVALFVVLLVTQPFVQAKLSEYL